jgi:toxin ParE1/3/4
MAFAVDLTHRAERDLAGIFSSIDAANSTAALKWYRGLKKAILNLERHPNRCPVVRKSGNLRNFLYGHRPHIYKVIFRVRESPMIVEVLHVRHGARRRFKSSDLFPPPHS